MDDKRYETFIRLIMAFDAGIDLSIEYDSLLHNYNGTILYQAESQMIKFIGDNPGITATEISNIQKKTGSASSQLIRKLRKKGYVIQKRDKQNNRCYNLFLTDEGERIYQDHKIFEERCYMRSFESLKRFSDKELETYIAIQKCLNSTFELDVEESREVNIDNGGKPA